MPWCVQQNIKIIRLWNFSGIRERQKHCNYKNNFLLINCFWLEWATGIVLGDMWARRETAFCSLHTCMLMCWLASCDKRQLCLPSLSRPLTPGPAVCVDLCPQGSQGRGNKNWPVFQPLLENKHAVFEVLVCPGLLQLYIYFPFLTVWLVDIKFHIWCKKALQRLLNLLPQLLKSNPCNNYISIHLPSMCHLFM